LRRFALFFFGNILELSEVQGYAISVVVIDQDHGPNVQEG